MAMIAAPRAGKRSDVLFPVRAVLRHGRAVLLRQRLSEGEQVWPSRAAGARSS